MARNPAGLRADQPLAPDYYQQAPPADTRKPARPARNTAEKPAAGHPLRRRMAKSRVDEWMEGISSSAAPASSGRRSRSSCSASRRRSLTVAEAALTAEAAAERALGRSLAAFPFPPAIAPAARGLIEANQARATLTAEQGRSSSLARLRSFNHRVQVAEAAVQAEMRLVSMAVDAPLPGA
jgi:hypothetical protein